MGKDSKSRGSTPRKYAKADGERVNSHPFFVESSPANPNPLEVTGSVSSDLHKEHLSDFLQAVIT